MDREGPRGAARRRPAPRATSSIEQAREEQLRMARKEEVVVRAERGGRAHPRRGRRHRRVDARARPRTTSTPSSRSSRSRCARSWRTPRPRRRALASTLDQVEVGRDRLRAPDHGRRAGVRAAGRRRSAPRRRSSTRRSRMTHRAAIDVRDLIGHPGASRAVRVGGHARGPRHRGRRACPTTRRSRATCCWSRSSRASSSRVACGGTSRCAARAA